MQSAQSAMKESSERNQTAWTPLHLSSRSARPLFCFPGAACSVTCFLPLVECIADEFSVYALQPRGLGDGMRPHDTVEAAVEDNISALQAIQASGPYRLLGHSYGGWQAFEMASRLVLAGYQVDSLVVLDTDPPHSPSQQMEKRTRLDIFLELIRLLEDSAGRSLRLGPQELEVLSTGAQVSKLTEAMKAAGLLSRGAPTEIVSDMVDVFEANANTRYTPAMPLGASVLLIHSKSRPASIEQRDIASRDENARDRTVQESTMAWRGYASSVDSIEIPGTHMSMLRKPQINVVAECITNPRHSAMFRRVNS
jgi:thioesterase domain-containing protein